MFHVIPVLKMSVHASYFYRASERVREWDIFKIGLLYTEQEKCSYKPILKEKIHVLMQAFQLDTEIHYCFAWVLMTGPEANQNPSITWCTHCSDLQITANQIIFHIFQEKSRGLHTRLPMLNHRRPFSDFYWGEGALVHRLHPWH